MNAKRLSKALRNRRGNIATLTALMLVPILAIVALAVELGVLQVHRAELQSAADAGSMAAAWELLESKFPNQSTIHEQVVLRTRSAAKQYAIKNCRRRQLTAVRDEDIELGYLADPTASKELRTDQPELFNTVRLRVRRDELANGPLRLLFGGLIGTSHADLTATATATLLANIRGFRTPADPTRKLPILPFALDIETWQNIEAGLGSDHWRWDREANRFVPGSDGVLEFNFFPQDTGSASNRGTVNIGADNNSTRRVSQQILQGISDQDLAFHGGQLEFDSTGVLQLGADPGISAGFKDELQAIIGQPRVLPVFSELSGNGNNGRYSIVRWVGIQIIQVNLTGQPKSVIAQAAPILVSDTIPGTTGEVSSQFVFSPIWLVE